MIILLGFQETESTLCCFALSVILKRNVWLFDVHVTFSRYRKWYFKILQLCFKAWAYSFLCKSFGGTVQCHTDAGKRNFHIFIERKEKFGDNVWRFGEQIRTRPFPSTPHLVMRNHMEWIHHVKVGVTDVR